MLWVFCCKEVKKKALHCDNTQVNATQPVSTSTANACWNFISAKS